ncbi:MAG: LysR family transcriptional regulator [Pseudomonadota bacterium]
MENWTEIKTAYLLGRLGTVSATAEMIGVHRATVIRRVESLECQLGGKLFQRHAKGYTPTDLGQELIRIAERSDQNFRKLIVKARTQDGDLAGQFVISCPELLDQIAFSAVKSFKSVHPNISVYFRPSNEVLKLEYGDADVAITLGKPPDHPDYVVRPLADLPLGLYCSSVSGRATTQADKGREFTCGCGFVLSEKSMYGEAVEQWIAENICEDQIVLTSSSIRGANDAIISGLGAGFLPNYFARRVSGLSQVVPPDPQWTVPTWLVTHVDLHRSAKVQSFLKFVKSVPQFTEPPIQQIDRSLNGCDGVLGDCNVKCQRHVH